ncbi:MAG: gamma-glutamylcyclotransferase [Neptuniibacter sp.]
MISVVGYGSLLSEQSARETVPGLQNFRIVSVSGYRRVFNKVGIVFLSRHAVAPDSLEIASCSTQTDPEGEILCSQFECTAADFAFLIEREHRFQWVEVETLDLAGQRMTGQMCTTSTDHYYRNHKCQSDREYHERVGQFYSGQIWRDDILPFPRYLAFCLQAAQGQGEEVLNNFLDSSFLADGITTVRAHINQHTLLRQWHKIDTGYTYRPR